MIQVPGKQIESVSASRAKRFNKYMNAVVEYQNRKDVLRTLTCLYIIHSEKLYLEAGYKSITELGVNMLHLSRGTISNYMTVARKFMNLDTAQSVFASDNKDFSYLQMVEMKKLEKDEVFQLLQSGMISYDSTAKEIKNCVSEYLDKKKRASDQAREDEIKPIREAYEAFHSAYNDLSGSIGDDDQKKEMLQRIMDAVVFIYNSNEKLWN